MAEIRFQLDEHMPKAVAEGLRRRGIDVLTAAEAGLLGLADAELLARSFAAGRVVVTQDSDYVRLHHYQHQHAGIAYSKRGSRTIGQLVASLTLIHKVFEPAQMAGHVEFL